MKTVAIIQARMGSTRLPGKVLMPLAGMPVLWHVIHRLRRCTTIDEIAIATSDLPIDDALVEFGAAHGVTVVRGPEENVLARFALAAAALEADYIVRITGDAPLVDPETIDLLVRGLIDRDADYCVGGAPVETIHEGFDPFSRRALDRLVAEAGDEPVAREHVSAYFKVHPDFGRTVHVPLPSGFEIEGVRTSVDTPADLVFLETLHRRLGSPAGEIDLRQAVRLLRDEPGLKQINQHVKQKSAQGRYGRVVVRCDGSQRTGLGHVTRCVALASELRDTFGMGVRFALGEEGLGAERVRHEGFPADIRPRGMEQEAWLDRMIVDHPPQALVLDIRNDLSPRAITHWRNAGVTVATIDDPSDRWRSTDLAFYPPVAPPAGAPGHGIPGELFIGWDYILLRREFVRAHQRSTNEPPVVLVTMGGSDPKGLTLLALEALEQIDEPFDAKIVLGPAFAHAEEIRGARPRLSARFEFLEDPPDLARRMADSDLAVAAFGSTAYELAAVGVPSVLLGLTRDHVRSASILDGAGMAVSLGLHTEVSSQHLADTIRGLLGDRALRHRMREATTLVDVLGAHRIARIIVERSAHTHG